MVQNGEPRTAIDGGVEAVEDRGRLRARERQGNLDDPSAGSGGDEAHRVADGPIGLIEKQDFVVPADAE